VTCHNAASESVNARVRDFVALFLFFLFEETLEEAASWTRIVASSPHVTPARASAAAPSSRRDHSCAFVTSPAMRAIAPWITREEEAA